jgi:hypothetical protein
MFQTILIILRQDFPLEDLRGLPFSLQKGFACASRCRDSLLHVTASRYITKLIVSYALALRKVYISSSRILPRNGGASCHVCM